jgi:hypothetical protein
MKKFSIIYLFLLLIGLNTVNAQATRSNPVDNQGWFSAGVDLDLPKKWKAELGYQARVFNDLKTFNGSFYSIGVEKGLSSWFALQTEYRLAKVLRGTFHRVSAGFVLDKKVNDLKLDLRVLYQNQIEDIENLTSEINQNDFIRMRIRGKKELSKKVDLVLSFEPIYQAQSGLQIDNYRIQGGLKYNFTKATSVDLFYFNRPDFAKSYKRQYHVFGIAFKHEIKIK